MLWCESTESTFHKKTHTPALHGVQGKFSRRKGMKKYKNDKNIQK